MIHQAVETARSRGKGESLMTKAIRMHRTGGPEVLQIEDIKVGDPGPGQVKIRHRAIGLNFIEVYFRKGMYPAELPFTPGNEGAGDVIAGPAIVCEMDSTTLIEAGCVATVDHCGNILIQPA